MAPAGWAPPTGEWLARNAGGARLDLLGTVPGAGVADAGCQSDLVEAESPRASAEASTSVRPRSGSLAGEDAVAAATPPRTPPAPSAPAKPLPPARCGFAAGGGVAACRRLTPLGPTPHLASRASRASAAASRAAGALAAASTASPPGALGRPLPRLTPQSQARAEAVEAAAERDRRNLASMAARLSQAERLNQLQAGKLARQSQEADLLRAEVRMLQQVVAERGAGHEDDEWSSEGAAARATRLAQELAAVRAERDRLERQVVEMTRFLEDYGLTWVGDETSSRDDDDEAEASTEVGAEPAASSPSSSSGGRQSPAKSSRSQAEAPAALPVDLQTLAARVEALGPLVERRGARIVSDRTAGGAVRARLVADDAPPLPLTVFADGVKLGPLPFHEHGSREAQTVLRDIMDGFFPYALKDDFPDGVAMKVIDRMSLAFDAWLRGPAACDPELADAGDRLLPPGGRVLRASAPQPRSGCRARGVSAPPGAAAAEAAEEVPQVSLLRPERDAAAPVARVQVKLEGGARVVFSAEPDATVGDLSSALERWRGGEGRPVALRSAFPPRTYDDPSQTLRDAGLVPSATLFVAAPAQEAPG